MPRQETEQSRASGITIMENPFDQLPDCILLDILDSVSDVKTLTRCRAVSKRFHALIPYASSLLLRVDRLLPVSTTDFSLLFSFVRTIIVSLFPSFSPEPTSCSSPNRILSVFRCIRRLDIQLPRPMTPHVACGGTDRRAFIKYKAVFGATLRTCVILMGFRKKGGAEDGQKEMDDEEEVKERVVWVVRTLVDACKRHAYVAREVVGNHPGLARLTMSDRGGEGEVEMDERGLEECRKGSVLGDGCWVPRVRMQMRYRRKMEVKDDGGDGEVYEGATLVVVRAVKDETMDKEAEDEAVTLTEAFGKDKYKEAARALIKIRSYSLEMNSFLI